MPRPRLVARGACADSVARGACADSGWAFQTGGVSEAKTEVSAAIDGIGQAEVAKLLFDNAGDADAWVPDESNEDVSDAHREVLWPTDSSHVERPEE